MDKKESRYLINDIDPYDFGSEVYKDTKIYTKKVPWSNVVYAQFLFNVGAIHDPIGKEGVAHFLEHMIFQGNKKYKNKFEIDQFSKNYTLDSLNAFTGFAHLGVHCRCLPEHLDKTLSGIKEILTSSMFRNKDIEDQRKVITQESWGVYKNEKRIEYLKKDRANIFYSMPDRLRIVSPLGWPDTIQNITKKDLLDMYETALSRSNLSVILTGKIGPGDIAKVKRVIDTLPQGEKLSGVYVPSIEQVSIPKENKWIFNRKDMGLSDAKQAEINLSMGISKFEKYTPGMRNLASTLLYELLHRDLRHNNSWCYSVHASVGIKEDFMYCDLGSKVDVKNSIEAILVIKKVIVGVLKGKYKKEFKQEKKLFLMRKESAEITTKFIDDSASSDLRYLGSIESRKQEFEDIESVTYKDVVDLLSAFYEKSGTLVTEVYLPDDVAVSEIKEKLK